MPVTAAHTSNSIRLLRSVIQYFLQCTGRKSSFWNVLPIRQLGALTIMLALTRSQCWSSASVTMLSRMVIAQRETVSLSKKTEVPSSWGNITSLHIAQWFKWFYFRTKVCDTLFPSTICSYWKFPVFLCGAGYRKFGLRQSNCKIFVRDRTYNGHFSVVFHIGRIWRARVQRSINYTLAVLTYGTVSPLIIHMRAAFWQKCYEGKIQVQIKNWNFWIGGHSSSLSNLSNSSLPTIFSTILQGQRTSKSHRRVESWGNISFTVTWRIFHRANNFLHSFGGCRAEVTTVLR